MILGRSWRERSQIMFAAALKRSLGYGLVHTPAVRLFQRPMGGVATVFVLHRFEVAKARHASTSVGHLRKLLAYLRRNDYQLLSLDEVVRSFHGEGPPLRKAVAFTVDDGYLDQATVGAPTFAEFDCPVTIFLASGFLDGAVVPWWDVVQHAFERSTRREVRVTVGGTERSYALVTREDRFQAEMDFLARCKDATDGDRLAALEALAEAADVSPPERPLPPDVPMSWEQARSLERTGVTFGPHTVTHPILSKVSRDTAEHEITESWRRLQQELDHPVAVFCYPNGRAVDFGDREIAIARDIGMKGALTVDDAQAEPGAGATDPDAPYRISRVSFPARSLDALFCVTGVDSAQHAVKHRLRSPARVA